jgi:hypothetical protein
MSATLSRTDRRRFKRLTDANEPTIQSDRLFFERRPDRTHRIRLASKAEVETMVLLKPSRRAPSGLRWYVALRQVKPGVRLRVFTLGYEGADTDVSEEVAAYVYGQASGEGSAAEEIETHLRTVMEAGR